jgi:hypothetical protein
MANGRELAERYLTLIMAARAAQGGDGPAPGALDPIRVGCVMVSLGAALVANQGGTPASAVVDTILEIFADSKNPIREMVAGLSRILPGAVLAADVQRDGLDATIAKMRAAGWDVITPATPRRKKGGRPS